MVRKLFVICIAVYVVFICGMPRVTNTTGTTIGPHSNATSEPLPEIGSFAEPSIVTESEPYSTPEGSVKPTSGPEGMVEPDTNNEPDNEPMSEGAFEPTSESESTVEPGVSVKPENAPISEGAFEPMSESESKVEPDASVETENEPMSEGAFKPTSQPESTVEPDASVETEYEPMSEGVTEPPSEPESTVEPGVSVESETEPMSEGAFESMSQPESTAEPGSIVKTENGPVSEGISEPTSEPKVTVEPGISMEPEKEPGASIEAEEPGASVEPEKEPVSEGVSQTSAPETELAVSVESEIEPGASIKPETEHGASVEAKTESGASVVPVFEPASEPEGTVEPGVNGEPENEPDASVEPEKEQSDEGISHLTLVPETEPGPSVEPASSASEEPENKPIYVGVFVPTSESEGTGDPSVIVESRVEPGMNPSVSVKPAREPGASAEPETELASVSTSERKGIAEPGTIAEPETKPVSSAEPENERVSESVSESTSEPVGANEPRSRVEPETEPETNATSEPSSEDVGEPSVEPEPNPETRPSSAEILLPPTFLVIGIITAIVCLILARKRACTRSKQHFWTSTFRKAKWIVKAFNARDNVQQRAQERLAEPFLTNFDMEVLASLRTFCNKPMELIRIAMPALISLALCPVTIYLYEPLIDLLWPKSDFVILPDINDAITCFLGPAGLVYATSFGFAFQQAMSKQHEVLMHVVGEVSMIDQIATLTSKIRLPSLSSRLEIYRAVKAEIIFMILQIEQRDVASFQHQPDVDVKVQIWSVLDILRGVKANNEDLMDRILCDKIATHITQINSICSDRMGSMHTRIHPLKWIFLETLGFFSFLGVLLLQAGGYRIELAMCIITVISISMLCYVVSDLDSPFSGFFRVDLSVFADVIKRLETIYENTTQGDLSMVAYPEMPNKKVKNKRFRAGRATCPSPEQYQRPVESARVRKLAIMGLKNV